jgi:hypothetical protein
MTLQPLCLLQADLFYGGFVLWFMVKRYDTSAKTKETTEYFLRIYKSTTKFAKFSILWIIIGGIPRTMFYKDFEWANAAGKGQIPALIVKHILAFTFVGLGAYLWIKINRKVKRIKAG